MYRMNADAASTVRDNPRTPHIEGGHMRLVKLSSALRVVQGIMFDSWPCIAIS
jgi:hypothetical protein